MRRSRVPVMMLLCVVVLFMQAGGLHLHLGHDVPGAVHGTHVHFTDTGDHDHGTDVTVFGLGAVPGKYTPILLSVIVVVVAFVRARGPAWFASETMLRPASRSRWRPPLRAPPLPAL